MFSSVVLPVTDVLIPSEHSGPSVVLEVDGLWSAVNKQFEIRGVDFRLYRGETLAIVGANGSGKSSLLRLLSGLAKPDQGHVRICGHASTDWRKTADFVGVVQQRKELPKHMTVRDYVMQQIDLRRAPRNACTDLLDMAGLIEFSDQQVTRLSGGNQRKLQILCALVHSPMVLLADEPSSGLDAQFQDEVIKYLNELKRKLGLSMVLVTHQLEEVQSLADVVAVMQNGRFVQIDRMDRIFSEASTLATLVLDPMNRNATGQDWGRVADILREIQHVAHVERRGQQVLVHCKRAAPEFLSETVCQLAHHGVYLHAVSWAKLGMKELIKSGGKCNRLAEEVITD